MAKCACEIFFAWRVRKLQELEQPFGPAAEQIDFLLGGAIQAKLIQVAERLVRNACRSDRCLISAFFTAAGRLPFLHGL